MQKKLPLSINAYEPWHIRMTTPPCEGGAGGEDLSNAPSKTHPSPPAPRPSTHSQIALSQIFYDWQIPQEWDNPKHKTALYSNGMV